MRSDTPNSVPVTVITGFLGSGKTTVLNRLLRLPDLADTAVIINEFGAVSLDHLLIEQALENAVLLKNGCICCTVRGDILDTLDELFRKRDAGELPWFRRIAIETTGLADPAPVVHTLSDTRQACHLDGIVVTVDAVHARAQLRDQAEARNQVAFADRILLTKTDLLAPGQADAAEPAIRAINTQAPIRRVVDGAVSSDDVFGLGPDMRPAHWLRAAAVSGVLSASSSGVPFAVPVAAPFAAPSGDHDHGHHDHDHDQDHDAAGRHSHHDDIAAMVLCARLPLPWPALALWLNSLLSLHGTRVLRLKGILRIAGLPRPVVLQAVHHVLHRPVFLSPEAERVWAEANGGPGGEIVVIQRGLPEAGLRASFAAAIDASQSRSD